MKIWILRPQKKIDNYKEPDNPWEPWYDKCFGIVVRAETEKEARQLASEEAMDEGKDAWLNLKYSECIELGEEGEKGVILKDGHWA